MNLCLIMPELQWLKSSIARYEINRNEELMNYIRATAPCVACCKINIYRFDMVHASNNDDDTMTYI
jgi:hypothetical protein